MSAIEIIKNYTEILESELGLDIIIYDECSLLSATGLTVLPQFRKWHTNPYCLKIKSSDTLRSKCVNLKCKFTERVLRGGGVVKSTCFAGVTEYAAAVKYKDELVCMVSATGYLGDARSETAETLSDSLGITPDELRALREKYLVTQNGEENVKKCVKILAYMISRYINEETKIPSLLDSARSDGEGYVVKAKKYIGDNFTEKITIASVAKYCNISRSRLEHLFSFSVGHGVAEEIRLCRIAYSKELLCTGEYPIKYIALLSGFASSDYFSTVFKRYTGVSPLTYRKDNRIY